MTRRRVSRGCGKLILFGEHSVVYGVPALVASLPMGATAWVRESSENMLILRDGRDDTIHFRTSPDDSGTPVERSASALFSAFTSDACHEVEVTLDIPIGAGLGSSAAFATAAARALSDFIPGSPSPDPRVLEAVEASEAIFHGDASGIDARAAMGKGVFRFVRDQEEEPRAIATKRSIYIAVCEAGPPCQTSVMVERVRALHKRQPQVGESLNRLVGDIVFQAQRAFEDGDTQMLGELADVNHGALVAMGVSTPELDHACHLARAAGARGAKLTGSGGGGCCFAIAERDSIANVMEVWDRHGLRPLQTVL